MNRNGVRHVGVAMIPLFICFIVCALAGATMDATWESYVLGSPIKLQFDESIQVAGTDDHGVWGWISGNEELARKNQIIYCEEGIWREVFWPEGMLSTMMIMKAAGLPSGAVYFNLSGWYGKELHLLFHQGKVQTVDEEVVFSQSRSLPKYIVCNAEGTVWVQHFTIPIAYDARIIAAIPPDTPLFDLLPHASFNNFVHSSQQFVLDANGRVWHTRRRGAANRSSIVIILPVNGEKPAQSLPDTPWSRAVVLFDETGQQIAEEYDGAMPSAAIMAAPNGMLWIVLDERTIWEVNPVTFESTMIFEADLDFEPIVHLAEIDEQLYIFTRSNIYRMDGHHVFPVLPGRHYVNRDALAVDDGFWVYTSPHADTPMTWFWFVPYDGSPARPVDEQSGVTINRCRGIVRTMSGRALAHDNSGGVSLLPAATEISALSPFRSAPQPGSIGQLPPDVANNIPGCAWVFLQGGIIRNKKGNIYCVVLDRADALIRWDGLSWEYLELPTGFADGDGEHSFKMDVLGNLWLFRIPETDDMPAAARFFPDEERWEIFTDMRALLTSLPPGEMVTRNLVYEGNTPFRDMVGQAAYLTPAALHVYREGVWEIFTAEAMWRDLSHTEQNNDYQAHIQTTFNRNTFAMIAPDGTPMLVMSSGQWVIYDNTAWRHISSQDERYIVIPEELFWRAVRKKYGVNVGTESQLRMLLQTGSTAPDELPTGWLPRLPPVWRMENGRLFRSFQGEQTPVFPENISVPLPAKPEIIHAQIGPGRYPVLSIASTQRLVVLEPVLTRPDITVESVDGNHIRLAAPNLEEDVTLYWRFRSRSQDGEGTGYRMMATGWVASQRGDPWKPLEGAETRLGPFQDGERIIEAMAIDAAHRTSEYYRVIVNIAPEEDTIEGWARQLIEAWPEPVSEAENALKAKGRESIDVLERMAVRLPDDETPALQRIIQIIDADIFVPAPDTPLHLPEPPDEADAGIITQTVWLPEDAPGMMVEKSSDAPVNYNTLQQDTEGWIWRLGFGHNRQRYVAVWTGQRWYGREAPTFEGLPLGIMHLDSMRRIWLSSSIPEEYLWVYTPLDGQIMGEGVWKRYANLFEALDTLWQPDLRFGPPPRYRSDRHYCLEKMAVLSNEIFVLLAEETVYVKQAGELRRWGAIEMPGALATSTRLWQCAFDNEQRPLIRRSEDMLRLNKDGQWHTVAYEACLEWALPSYASRWEMRRDGLYRHDFGVSGLVVTRECLALQEGVPAIVSDGVESPCGSLLFRVNGKRRDESFVYRIYWPLERPDTQAMLASSETGFYKIRLMSDDDAMYHTWRIAGGDWQPATREREIHLPIFPLGRHTVEVCAVNAAALADLTPLRFELEMTAEAVEMEHIIESFLHGSTSERDHAVQWLYGKGSEVLPRLNALLTEIEDENVRWQIEALIQRIQ